MTDDDLTRTLADAETWAREHVKLVFGPASGKTGALWIAQLRTDTQLFEARAHGEVTKREVLRQRASDAVVRDYLQWIRQAYHRTKPESL